MHIIDIARETIQIPEEYCSLLLRSYVLLRSYGIPLDLGVRNSSDCFIFKNARKKYYATCTRFCYEFHVVNNVIFPADKTFYNISIRAGGLTAS